MKQKNLKKILKKIMKVLQTLIAVRDYNYHIWVLNY